MSGFAFSAHAADEIKPAARRDAKGTNLFARDNLVAWCIVPFDSKKRGPVERVAMLRRLGFRHYAYDWRDEHLPTFDAEIGELQKNDIELTAVWFPALDASGKKLLQVLKDRGVKTQLWVTGGGEPAATPELQRQRIVVEAARIRPIAEAASAQGCTVALYNHGGWFGEPENQLAIIDELKRPDVKIVYNLHHGHAHLSRFPELLKKMLPHLVVLNLNGMAPNGDAQGRKILPLGAGDVDLDLLKTIRDSGYRGPIGILGHTNDDAEERLQDNLDGLDWLLPQLSGMKAGAKPKYRTPVPPAPASAN
ncbi:MAG TPA: TIM barrel protein [Planctomycetaceae bacterium]